MAICGNVYINTNGSGLLAGLRKANGCRKEGLPPAFSLLMKIGLETKGERIEARVAVCVCIHTSVRSLFLGWINCLSNPPLVSFSPVAYSNRILYILNHQIQGQSVFWRGKLGADISSIWRQRSNWNQTPQKCVMLSFTSLHIFSFVQAVSALCLGRGGNSPSNREFI